MKKRLVRRDPDKERQWRELMRRQERSGLSVRAFCCREEIKESAFYWWRRELARRRRKDSPVRQDRKTIRFLPVTLTPEQGATGCGIELRGGGGYRIVVRPGFDRPTLAGVLAVLEGRGC